MYAWACAGATAIGRVAARSSILSSARAKGSPLPRSSAALRSASNSRLRLTAIWMSPAASGAIIETRRTANGFGLSSSLLLPANIVANMAIWAIDEIAVAMAAATEPMRMSLLRTCISSWAITPSTSSRESEPRRPVVAHTTAFDGLRPVANAFG